MGLNSNSCKALLVTLLTLAASHNGLKAQTEKETLPSDATKTSESPVTPSHNKAEASLFSSS
jgi:hypothetical protein